MDKTRHLGYPSGLPLTIASLPSMCVSCPYSVSCRERTFAAIFDDGPSAMMCPIHCAGTQKISTPQDPIRGSDGDCLFFSLRSFCCYLAFLFVVTTGSTDAIRFNFKFPIIAAIQNQKVEIWDPNPLAMDLRVRPCGPALCQFPQWSTAVASSSKLRALAATRSDPNCWSDWSPAEDKAAVAGNDKSHCVMELIPRNQQFDCPHRGRKKFA